MEANQTQTLEAISKLVAEQVTQQLPRLVQEEMAKRLPWLRSSSLQCNWIPAASREAATGLAANAAAAAHHLDRHATTHVGRSAQHSTQKQPPTLA